MTIENVCGLVVLAEALIVICITVWMIQIRNDIQRLKREIIHLLTELRIYLIERDHHEID